MNKAQKRLILNVLGTLVIIVVFIFAFANFKDYVNKTETIRAFNQLGEKVLEYRKRNGILPNESVIDDIKKQIEGSVRIGNIYYRAQWISIDSPPETIVAYAEKKYNTFIESGYVLLRLDGEVEYLPVKEFKKILDKQETMAEAEEIKRGQKSIQPF
jgi:hypothetical protein